MHEHFRLPRVKVCGMTRSEDVELAVSAGADAIGVISHRRSPRHVEADQARALVSRLPRGVTAVAVFVDGAPEEILAWAREAGASAVQLCGEQVARQWLGFDLPILRRVAVDGVARAEIDHWACVARAFVLDHPSDAGGTGREVDFDLAAELAARADCLLAGGLHADNVERAVRRVRPAGVDASSRLEAVPGEKDPERVRAFVARALAALEDQAR